MKRLCLLAVVAVLPLACQDSQVSPTSPDQLPGLSADVTVATSSAELCGGWSPCDGYEGYAETQAGRPPSTPPAEGGIGTGNPGTFFLPELVDNHKPFNGMFLSGLADFLSVKVCEGERGSDPDPTDPSCVEPQRSASAFSEQGDFYSAQWKPGRPDNGQTWRVHVLLGGELLLAFRDVLVDAPSSVNPADGEVLSVRQNSNVNIKVAITDASGIQVGDCSGAAGEEIICVIPGGTEGSVTISTGTGSVVANFNEGFPLLIGAAACDGPIDVDLPLYGPCVEMEAPSVSQALVNSSILFCDPSIAPPADVFVLQQSTDEGTAGTLALPAVSCPVVTAADSRDGLMGLISGGVQKVANLLGARDLIATSAVGHSGGGALSRFGSKFQLALGAYMGPAAIPALPAIVDLGDEIPVAIQVQNGGEPGNTVRFFPDADGFGSLRCPAVTVPATCDDGGSGVVFVTDATGVATALWTPGSVPGAGGKQVSVYALGAGIGVEGSDSQNNGDIQGTLIPFDRDPLDDRGANNGPVEGLDGFEPFPHQLSLGGKPVALNDLSLVQTVLVCGPGVSPDVTGDDLGIMDEAWQCAGDSKLEFIANLSGKKPREPNAELFAMDDGTDVYFGLKVEGTTEIADLFINFSQTGLDGSADEGDDLILLRADGSKADMYSTLSCVSSEGKTLCGADDPISPTLVAGAKVNPGGFVFYEFQKPRCSEDTGEDFNLCLDENLWSYLTFTGGRGGGKGSTIAEDFREWTRLFGGGSP